MIYGVEPLSPKAPLYIERTEGALRKLLDEVGASDLISRQHVRIGHAPRRILEFADERRTDLIVLASHGRTGLSRLLIGSVAEKVVRLAPCPVFTVKSYGKNLMMNPGSDNLENLHAEKSTKVGSVPVVTAGSTPVAEPRLTSASEREAFLRAQRSISELNASAVGIDERFWCGGRPFWRMHGKSDHSDGVVRRLFG